MHPLKTQHLKWLKVLFFSSSFFFFSQSYANSASIGYDFKVEKEFTKSAIQLSYQMSQLKAESEQLSSTGFLLGYGYDFTPEFSVQSQFLLSLQQSGTSTMTGFGLFGAYNFFRSSNTKSTNIKIDNRRLMTFENTLGNYLELGLGAQQFYFNGSRGVYSVSGPAIRAAYNFDLFGFNTTIGLQSASVQLAEKSTQLTTVIVGLIFPL